LKIQNNIKWVSPFIDSVKDIIPLHKVKRITGYKVPMYKEEIAYASITRVSTRTYNINLRLTNNDTQKSVFLASFLDSLAHELAHLVYWKHDHRHFALQVKVLSRFSKVLKKCKIKDTYSRIKI
jgi:hypothetical protein